MDPSKQNEKMVRMTTKPVGSLIVRLAIPTIVTMMITAVYNMADTYFVGQLHDISATGAVGIVFSFMAILQAVGFFFGQGSGNYISRKLGAGETETAQTMATTGIVLAFCSGAVIMALGLLFLDPLVTLLQATPTIRPYARQYLVYILFAAPFMCSSLVMNNQLRFQGNAFYGMIGMTAGGILNMGLDPLFIYVFHMGVSGAAIATMISQFVSFCILLAMLFKSDAVKPDLRKFSFKFKWMKEIFCGGIPSLCRQGIGSIATMCLNAGAAYVGTLMGTGDAPITAMTVVTKVMAFANSAMIGFGQGFQPVCGINYGAGKYDRVKEAFWFCVKWSVAALVAFSAFGIFFARPLVRSFQDDTAVVEFGIKALRWQCSTFFFSSWITCCNMMQQTMGKALQATALAIARQGVTFIPLVVILPRLIGETGVQIAQPISDIFTLAISIPLQISVFRELDKASKNASANKKTA